MAKQKRPTGKQDASPWPTLEEQLAAAKVIPGNALEKLIRDNQDFEMLDPSENPDDVWKLPLWIRVYFRKQHPEIEFSGPGAGYPLILKEIYTWMLQHQDLPGATGRTASKK
jgi:hypothetical protein